MATVRPGDKSALLVVDVQVGVMAQAWNAAQIINRVARTAERARDLGVSVIWVQHADHHLISASAAWQWVPELTPVPAERLIHKHFNSAFERTELESTLSQLGITHIVLAGAASNWCIRATAYAALERGNDLTLVSDAHTTETAVLENGARIEAEGVVEDLNATMTWLRYPGRVSGIASAETVSFHP